MTCGFNTIELSDTTPSDTELLAYRPPRDRRRPIVPVETPTISEPRNASRPGGGSETAWACDIRLSRHICDFSRWKNHDAYSKALDRLLGDPKQDFSLYLQRKGLGSSAVTADMSFQRFNFP